MTRSESAESVFDVFASLVDQSLVRRLDEGDGSARYVMLGTVKEFAAEQLADLGESETTGDAHAVFFLALLRNARNRFETTDRRAARQLVERERDNVRAALKWAMDRGDAKTAQGIASSQVRFWVVMGLMTEARGWLAQASALPGLSSPADRAETLFFAASLAIDQNDLDRGGEFFTAAERLAEESGYALGHVHVALLRAHVARWRGEFAAAALSCERAVALVGGLDEPIWHGIALRDLGVIERARGNHDNAVARFEESLAVFRRLDHPWGIPAAQRDLGQEALHRGDFSNATALFHESLLGWRLLGEPLHLGGNLWGLARVALVTRQAEAAARLLGAKEAFAEAMGRVPSPEERNEHNHALDAARAALGDAAFDALRREGLALSVDGMIAAALAVAEVAMAEPMGSGARPEPMRNAISLTSREVEVLRLLTDGRSDRAIAAALFISPRTASAHVGRILTKLEVQSRTAAAAHAIRYGLI